MKVTVISANLNKIDATKTSHTKQDMPQGIQVEYLHFDDSHMPPRPLSISSRMQAKVYKMCGFDYAPDADFIVWLDSSYVIINPNFIWHILTCMGANDICLMPHPHRQAILAEAQEVIGGMSRGSEYLLSRYKDEPMMEQVLSYQKDPTFKDSSLAAAGCFIYKNNGRIRAMLKDWLIECVKWSCQDQLSLSYVLHKHRIHPNWLGFSIFNNPYLRFINHS